MNGNIELVISIGFTLFTGSLMMGVYRLCHDALTYNRRFNITLLMLSFVSTILLTLIQNNPMLSLGVLGSLSLKILKDLEGQKLQDLKELAEEIRASDSSLKVVYALYKENKKVSGKFAEVLQEIFGDQAVTYMEGKIEEIQEPDKKQKMDIITGKEIIAEPKAEEAEQEDDDENVETDTEEIDEPENEEDEDNRFSESEEPDSGEDDIELESEEEEETETPDREIPEPQDQEPEETWEAEEPEGEEPEEDED